MHHKVFCSGSGRTLQQVVDGGSGQQLQRPKKLKQHESGW